MSHIPTPWRWWNSETRHTVSWFIIVCTIYVFFFILLALLCTCSIWFSLPVCMLYIVLLQTSTTRSQCLFIHSSWLLLLFLASYWLLDMCSVSLLTIFSLTLEMDNCPICSRSVLPHAKKVKCAVCHCYYHIKCISLNHEDQNYSTANKIFAFLAGNGSAGLSAERPLPARAGHLWYSHLLSRWRHL